MGEPKARDEKKHRTLESIKAPQVFLENPGPLLSVVI